MESREASQRTVDSLTANETAKAAAEKGLIQHLFDEGLAGVRDWYTRHQHNKTTTPLLWTLGLQLVVFAVLIVWLPFDSMEVEGRARFIKPLNFTQSFAVYLATVVVLLDYLRATDWWKKVISWGVSICITSAITCITMQAVRGTTSHFNQSTPFDLAVSTVMDIVDPINSIFVFVLFMFALQKKFDLSIPTQLGFTFGLALFLVGGIAGGVMVFQGQNVVGVEPGGPGLPILNWSTVGGDLRVAHFAGIHAIQILPITGWLINQVHWLGKSMPAKRALVTLCGSGYLLIMGFVFVQALNGLPLVRL